MSPLWLDEVTIQLAPRKLRLARRRGLFKPRVVASSELTVTAGAPGDLGPVLARLADALTDPLWQGAEARVVVADHRWVRYALVPWPKARLDAAGRLAHARCVLGDAFGEAVSDWTVGLADTPPGRDYLACAMPATLRGSLEDALAPARLTLVSLQPRLIAAFNAWRHRLPADDAWFVSLGDGLMSSVHLRNGAWDRVQAHLAQDFAVELERLQALAQLTRTDGARAQVFVDAPLWMRAGVSAGAGLTWLEEDKGDGAESVGLALLQRRYA